MAERPRVVVDVMPKPEILDPQGQAIAAALPKLGFAGVRGVRAGKRFEIELEGELTPAALAEVREAAARLLANPVIEDYTVHVEGPVEAGAGGRAAPGATGAPERGEQQ